MVIVAEKIVDFNGIAGILMGLKPDIVSIHRIVARFPDIFIERCDITTHPKSHQDTRCSGA